MTPSISNDTVEKVARAIYDQWQTEFEAEYTEAFEDYGHRQWFLNIAKPAIEALLASGEVVVREKS